MADVNLLPLPEWTKRDDLGGLVPSEVRAEMQAYARANVAHATAAKDAEIEALRARLAEDRALLDAVRDAMGGGPYDTLPARTAAQAAEVEALRAEVERLQEVVRPKRENECLTLDHWRMRAYYLEANWSRCSRACAAEQTKREQAEARAEQLAAEVERLRRLVQERDTMLGKRLCAGTNADGKPRCLALAEEHARAERLRAEVELWRHKAAVHQYRRKRLAEALRDARRALAFAAQHLPECNEPYERANAALAQEGRNG